MNRLLADTYTQELLFPTEETVGTKIRRDSSSTFVDNMKLPVHRWFRFSAGFSAQWVEQVIAKRAVSKEATILDPFAGSGTSLLAAERVGVRCLGIEAHPFIVRIAKAKLFYRSDPTDYLKRAAAMRECAGRLHGRIDSYPKLIRKCFADEPLERLDRLRRAWEKHDDRSPASELLWLTLVSILRTVSHVGTAPWQYVLPSKRKNGTLEPFRAFDLMGQTVAGDMRTMQRTVLGPQAVLFQSDARTCSNVPNNSVDLVITSPPYANNYDYADATRLEMSFMGEISGWGELQETVRRHLIRSCSQHVPEGSTSLDAVLSAQELLPIRKEITDVCTQLSEIRQNRGGRKTYYLMVACYFLDMARTWIALRRVCKASSLACFVIGDSAPYGIYVPVIKWLGELACAAGFNSYEFEKTRDRNVKWKNRKHRVPLCEGRLWVSG